MKLKELLVNTEYNMINDLNPEISDVVYDSRSGRRHGFCVFKGIHVRRSQICEVCGTKRSLCACNQRRA